MNNSVLNLNMKEEPIVAKKIVKDHMISNGLKPYTVPTTDQLIRSVATARQKYHDSLAKSKLETKQKKANDEKLIITEDLKVVTAKRDELKNICESFNAEFVSLVEHAEEKMDMSFVSKANAFKRKAEEKEKQVSKLDETIALLVKKTKDILDDLIHL